MDDFKVPHEIHQDLLLIHDIISTTDLTQLTTKKAPMVATVTDDSIDSLDSENASEDKIEADLIVATQVDGFFASKPTPDTSDSSSDSESDSELSDTDPLPHVVNVLDDDEEPGPPTTKTYFQTKNELAETQITIPHVTEVGPEVVLEKVGEIMSVTDKIVIVRSVPSESNNKGSERALDSDTLLVFDDRKVMGYIYETFGPTLQPLYQVKYNDSYPLNPEQVRVSREVFHVPQHSHFIFLSQIKKMKGSDASNLHDEEPGEHELDFSDDEAEAAFKSSFKRKRAESRANSVASSRQATPTPSQMRDQELADSVILGRNAYDEHGPYDIDFSAGPSRPPPIPYDDPYADEYASATSHETTILERSSDSFNRNPSQNVRQRSISGIERGSEGRGRGHRGEARGRGRSRGRGRGDRGERGRVNYSRDDASHGSRRGDMPGESYRAGQSMEDAGEPYDPRNVRPMSPTSLAIARATGQLPNVSNFVTPHSHVSTLPSTQGGMWSHHPPQSQQFNFSFPGYPLPFVQPHINPRFASAFGVNMDLVQSQSYMPYSRSVTGQPLQSSNQSTWADEWTVHSSTPAPQE